MMEQYKATPYNGSEPYIYICYSQRDWESAKMIIDALHSRGYRIWWDAGVQVGEMWVDKILERLSNSEACILLLSEKFENSNACMNELDFMVWRSKPIIPICLNDYDPNISIELSIGIVRTMRIHDNTISPDFLDALTSIPSISKCMVSTP